MGLIGCYWPEHTINFQSVQKLHEQQRSHIPLFCKVLELIPVFLQLVTASLDFVRAAMSLVDKFTATQQHSLKERSTKDVVANPNSLYIDEISVAML